MYIMNTIYHGLYDINNIPQIILIVITHVWLYIYVDLLIYYKYIYDSCILYSLDYI